MLRTTNVLYMIYSSICFLSINCYSAKSSNSVNFQFLKCIRRQNLVRKAGDNQYVDRHT